MDIQKIIDDLLKKFNVDSGLVEKFKKDPAGTVKELLKGLGVDLDAGQIKSVVDGLSAKLNIEDVVKQGTGFLAKLKGLFGGK